MSIHRLAFGSDILHCGTLRSCVQAFGKAEGYGGEFLEIVELAVHEAFVNAVRHANGSDPALPVSILLHAGRDGGSSFLQVEIADCGQGFTPVGPGEACGSGDVRKLSGRGLGMIFRGTESIRVEPRNGGSLLVLRYITS